MSDFLVNDLEEILGLHVFQKYVKDKISTYNVREQYEELIYNEDGTVDHDMKTCFLGKTANVKFITDGDLIVEQSLDSETLNGTVSRVTRPRERMYCRLTEDNSHKKDGEVLTKTQVQYTTVLDVNQKEAAIIRETYKSDPDEPEKLVKKLSEITDLKKDLYRGSILEGTENFIANSTNMVADYMKSSVRYATTVDDEFIKIDHRIWETVRTNPEFDNYIVPIMNDSHLENENRIIVEYKRAHFQDSAPLAREWYTYDPDSGLLELIKVERGSRFRADIYRQKDGTYNYVSTTNCTTGHHRKVYDIVGVTNRPLSAGYFIVDYDNVGLPVISHMAYMGSRFMMDSGRYYLVSPKLTEARFNENRITQYDHDEYGVINSQIFITDEGTVEGCEYNRFKNIDDEGNYLGTWIESFIWANPISMMKTNEFFYRAVQIQGGEIVKDYRAVLLEVD